MSTLEQRCWEYQVMLRRTLCYFLQNGLTYSDNSSAINSRSSVGEKTWQAFILPINNAILTNWNGRIKRVDPQMTSREKILSEIVTITVGGQAVWQPNIFCAIGFRQRKTSGHGNTQQRANVFLNAVHWHISPISNRLTQIWRGIFEPQVLGVRQDIGGQR